VENNRIYQKMNEVKKDIGAIGKDQQNSHFKYKFRGIDDIFNHVSKTLIKHGVLFWPNIVGEPNVIIEGKQVHVIAVVKYTFVCVDDPESKIETSTLGQGVDSGDKASYKAMSGACKYALLQTFCIPTDEPKDAEHHSPEPKTPDRLPAIKAAIKAHVKEKRTDKDRDVMSDTDFMKKVAKSYGKLDADKAQSLFNKLTNGCFNWDNGEETTDEIPF